MTWIALVVCCGAGGLIASATPPVPVERDGQADFDFLFGSWKIKNRVLAKPLSGSHEWYEFEATAIERPIWGGKGNVEELDGDSPKGHLQGLAVRLYDPVAKHWSIYWADRRFSTVGFPPAVGVFHGNRGEFFSDGEYQGKKTLDRLVWISLGKNTARWEQASSLDQGKTWETNWTMDFTRTAP